MSKVLTRRQARWLEIQSAYYFVNEHLKGTKNTTDGPSRRLDYEIGSERLVDHLLATTRVEPFVDLILAIIGAQAVHSLALDLSMKLVD